MGAWTTTYHEGVHAPPDTPIGYAILALKAELVYNGFEGHMLVSTPNFGPRMAEQTRRFQHQNGLRNDGVIGPHTAAVLYQKRFGVLEGMHKIPGDLLCRLCHLESGVDPGAVGVADPADHGIVQINARAHPELTLADAFNAEFALGYAARSISRIATLLDDWDCGVCAWNIGGGAAQLWCAAGKPSSAIWTFDDGSTWDYGAQATRYLELIGRQACP